MALNKNQKDLLEEYKRIHIRSKCFAIFYLIVFIIILIIGLVLTITNISNEINAHFITGIIMASLGFLFTMITLICLKYLIRKLKKFNNTD